MPALYRMTLEERRDFFLKQIDLLTPPSTIHQEILLKACYQLLSDIESSFDSANVDVHGRQVA